MFDFIALGLTNPFFWTFASAWFGVGVWMYNRHRKWVARETIRQMFEMTEVLTLMDQEGQLNHSPEQLAELNEVMRREYPLAMKNKELRSLKPKGR